eukprot:TRINITY_DN2853_c0_g1_i3.p1 TRINITY_DN2853_c0_g1~~TRINITY_DN2853_c0_g1_i3.p1  ORF type:complete len:113 (+),score=12.61 TRINITY_DN2853_c0_g1_i3:187-525(+)
MRILILSLMALSAYGLNCGTLDCKTGYVCVDLPTGGTECVQSSTSNAPDCSTMNCAAGTVIPTSAPATKPATPDTKPPTPDTKPPTASTCRLPPVVLLSACQHQELPPTVPR